MLDERAIFLAQAQALLDQFDWAGEMLRSNQLDKKIRDAASRRFSVFLEKHKAELRKLRDAVADGDALETSWGSLADFRKDYRDFFQECLGLLGGSLIRERKLDGGLCEIADALLRDIGERTIPWSGFCVLAEGNFYTETSEVVRLPFHDRSVWSLPVAAHELGHYVGPRIKDGNEEPLFKAALEVRKGLAGPEEGDLKRLERHYHEFLADLFALYTLGPAYACACLLLRFSPADRVRVGEQRRPAVCEDGETHPSHARRADLMLLVLKQLDKAGAGYGGMHNFLAGAWKENVKAAGLAACLETKGWPKTQFLSDDLYPIVTEWLPKKARYDGWSRAVGLRDDLKKGTPPQEACGDEDRIADVLNAAWLWRVEAGPDDWKSGAVSDRALKYCREIMGRGI